MPFETGPKELREIARLEEEAGLDWGAAAREYLKQIRGEATLAVEQREPEKEQGKSEV